MIVETEDGVDLLKCPICGSGAVLKSDGVLRIGVPEPTPNYWVKCSSSICGISPLSSFSRQEAIEKWNNRVP